MKHLLRGVCLILISITVLSTNKGLGQTVDSSQGGGGFGCSNSTSGSGGTDALTISPAGTVIVTKDNTQQFTANKSNVTWTLVTSDSESVGEVSSTGLYTPPTTLPVNPQVTVQATSSESTTQATVNLRTGTNLTFNSPTQINGSTLQPINGIDNETHISGNAGHIVTKEGSLQTDFIWLDLDDSTLRPDAFFNQQNDLTSLVGAQNLTNTSSSSEVPQSIIVDDNLNPSIFIATATELQFFQSSNGGSSFSALSTIDSTTDPTSAIPATAVGRIDSNNTLHVAYTNNLDILVPYAQTGEVKYGKSTDGGLTWSTQVINSSSSVQMNPAMAISQDGQEIYLCWANDLETFEDFEIMFAKSSNGGSSWSTPLQLKNHLGISPNESISIFCQIGLGPNDEIYLTFNDGPSVFNHHLFLAKSTNGGQSFTGPVQISTQTLNQVLYYNWVHFMEVDSLGRIDITWPLSTNSLIPSYPDFVMFARSTDEGASFSSNVVLAGGLGFRTMPLGLTHDSSGRVHILYADSGTSTSEYNVFYIRGE